MFIGSLGVGNSPNGEAFFVEVNFIIISRLHSKDYREGAFLVDCCIRLDGKVAPTNK